MDTLRVFYSTIDDQLVFTDIKDVTEISKEIILKTANTSPEQTLKKLQHLKPLNNSNSIMNVAMIYPNSEYNCIRERDENTLYFNGQLPVVYNQYVYVYDGFEGVHYINVDHFGIFRIFKNQLVSPSEILSDSSIIPTEIEDLLKSMRDDGIKRIDISYVKQKTVTFTLRVSNPTTDTDIINMSINSLDTYLSEKYSKEFSDAFRSMLISQEIKDIHISHIPMSNAEVYVDPCEEAKVVIPNPIIEVSYSISPTTKLVSVMYNCNFCSHEKIANIAMCHSESSGLQYTIETLTVGFNQKHPYHIFSQNGVTLIQITYDKQSQKRKSLG